MDKLCYLVLLTCIFVSCKQDKSVVPLEVESETHFDTKKFPPRVNVNTNAQAILTNWPEYNAFETAFDALYRISNEKDLRLVIDDLVEKQKLLEASEYPAVFDNPQIKGRQKVLKTFVLKVRGALEYRTADQEGIADIIKAYNAFRNQFNVMANNTLDTKLILDE